MLMILSSPSKALSFAEPRGKEASSFEKVLASTDNEWTWGSASAAVQVGRVLRSAKRTYLIVLMIFNSPPRVTVLYQCVYSSATRVLFACHKQLQQIHDEHPTALITG